MSNGEIKRYDLDWNYGDPIIDEDMNGDYVKHSDYVAQASTIVALKEQVSTLQAQLGERDENSLDAGSSTLMNESALRRMNELKDGMTGWGTMNFAAPMGFRPASALASQPAAPVQPDALTTAQALHLRNLTLDYAALAFQGTTLLDGDAVVATIRNMKSLPIDISVLGATQAAPPVQQPSDVREAFCIAKADPLAWGDPDLAEQRAAFCQALATTRPSAALTDSDIIDIARKFHSWGFGYSQDISGDWTIPRLPNCIEDFARAILAASSGAVAVPEGLALSEDELRIVRASKRIMVDSMIQSNMAYEKCGAISHRLENLIDELAAPATPAQGQTK